MSLPKYVLSVVNWGCMPKLGIWVPHKLLIAELCLDMGTLGSFAWRKKVTYFLLLSQLFAIQTMVLPKNNYSSV